MVSTVTGQHVIYKLIVSIPAGVLGLFLHCFIRGPVFWLPGSLRASVCYRKSYDFSLVGDPDMHRRRKRGGPGGGPGPPPNNLGGGGGATHPLAPQ